MHEFKENSQQTFPKDSQQEEITRAYLDAILKDFPLEIPGGNRKPNPRKFSPGIPGYNV